MKYIVLVTFFLSFFSLHAQEISKDEFPFIQPISLEEMQDTATSSFIDADKDGVEDAYDACPQTKANANVDRLGCLMLHDSDDDGISDRDDKCPNTNKGANVNAQGCEPDSDADGIADARDECPDTSKNFIVDTVGCPQTAILKIHFKTKEFTLTEKSLPELRSFADFLEKNKGYQVVIYGYTDSKNKTGNNKELSQKRANAVADALIDLGITLTRLTSIGMGSKNPIADNDTPEGRAKNRRIEVELLQ